MTKRFPELDLLRTVAILCMVVFHGAYDLAVFYDRDIQVFDTGWTLFARATACLFLLLVGVSFAISASRKETVPHLWKRQHNRFLILAAAAALISIVTYVADPETFVRFGILHLIALSMLLLPLCRRLKEASILLGIAVVLLGQWTHPTDSLAPTLSLVLGFPPAHFTTVDYFPLLPWFGVILMGYGLGHFLYVRSTTWRRHLPDALPQSVTWPGRHSLLIYLLHQPILLAALYFLHT